MSLESLRVTPGKHEVYNPEIYGPFVILVVNSINTTTNNTEKSGVVVPYSYIQNSSAELASKSVPLDQINKYLARIVIPEIWSNYPNILQPQLYLAVSIVTEDQVNYLIQEKESNFYLPYHTALAVIAQNALGARDFKGVLSQLSYHLKVSRLEWEEKVEEIKSPEFSNSVLTQTLPIMVPYFLHPALQLSDERNITNINECYVLSQDKEFGNLVVSTPEYCTLVHDINYVEFLESALPCLCNQEVRDVVTNDYGGEGLYLFSLSYLSNSSNLVEGNKRPLNSLQEGLRLLDYYVGFPTNTLNLNGLLMTGDLIPACFHGPMYNKDVKNPIYYSGEEKINLLYPEYTAYTLEGWDEEKIRTSEIHELRRRGNNKYNILSINNNGKEELIKIDVDKGSKIKILVTQGDLGQRAKEIYEVVLSFFASAVLVEHPKFFLITGAHRDIKISVGTQEKILRNVFSVTRGWITGESDSADVDGVRDCILSSTCLYSAFNHEMYNYYQRVQGNFDRDRYILTNYYDRGYKRAHESIYASNELRAVIKKDEVDENKSTGDYFSVFNPLGNPGGGGIVNIYYRTGTERFFKAAYPESYSDGTQVFGRQGTITKKPVEIRSY